MNFEVINRMKKEKGLTNKQISEQSGVTLSTLDKITSGANTNPKLDTLKAICRVLGCRLDDFDDLPNDLNTPISISEYNLLKKYRKLDEHGREAVDVILNVEHKRIKRSDEDYLTPMAAHNDKGEDPEEQKLIIKAAGEIIRKHKK